MVSCSAFFSVSNAEVSNAVLSRLELGQDGVLPCDHIVHSGNVQMLDLVVSQVRR